MKRPNKKAFLIAAAGYAAVVGLTCEIGRAHV